MSGCFAACARTRHHGKDTRSFMAKKTVALVGHCGPDSTYLRIVVARAAGRETEVVSADDDSELKALLSEGVDLLLLNRELGCGFDETLGVDLIKRLRAHSPSVKTMLVSNYPD